MVKYDSVNEEILLVGNEFDDNLSGLFVSAYDTINNLKWTSIYNHENSTLYSINEHCELAETPLGTYLIFNDLFNGANDQLLTEIDRSGQEIRRKVIKETTENIGNIAIKTIVLPNKIILGSTRQRSSFFVDYSLIFLDDSLNKKREFYYGSDYKDEWLSDIIPLPNHDYLLLGSQNPIWSSSNLASNKISYYLVRIDSSGNVLQEIKSKGTKDSNPSNGVYYRDENGEARIAFGCSRWVVDEWNDL